MDVWNDIATRARVLAEFAPDNAERLHQTRRSLEIAGRYEEDNPRWRANDMHALNCWQASIREAHGLMNELAVLVCRHLPEFRSKWVRVNPRWRHDDPKTDWTAIVDELERIEDAAIRHAGLNVTPAAETPKRTGSPTVTLDKFKQGTPLERVAAKIYEAEPDGNADVLQRAAIIDNWNKTAKRTADKISRDQRASVTTTVSKIRRALNPNQKPNSTK